MKRIDQKKFLLAAKLLVLGLLFLHPRTFAGFLRHIIPKKPPATAGFSYFSAEEKRSIEAVKLALAECQHIALLTDSMETHWYRLNYLLYPQLVIPFDFGDYPSSHILTRYCENKDESLDPCFLGERARRIQDFSYFDCAVIAKRPGRFAGLPALQLAERRWPKKIPISEFFEVRR